MNLVKILCLFGVITTLAVSTNAQQCFPTECWDYSDCDEHTGCSGCDRLPEAESGYCVA